MIEEIESDDAKCQGDLYHEAHEEMTTTVLNMGNSLRDEIRSLDRRENDIIKWLSSDLSMQKFHNDVHRKSEHCRDRGSWFVEEISDWIKNGTTSVYWLHGICEYLVIWTNCSLTNADIIVGMGKTFLMYASINPNGFSLVLNAEHLI